jgi:hypothetical protein
MVIAHLRKELRRLQELAVGVSRMAQQAHERTSWLQAEIVRGEEQLRRLQDTNARDELVELRKQNGALHLDLDTALQNEQRRAKQTLEKLSAEGVRQVTALSSAATAQMLAALSQGPELAADVLAMSSPRQSQPQASDKQVVCDLRAEVRRQATELTNVLIQERRAHKCVTEAEDRLNDQAQRLQQLGGTHEIILKKVAAVSAKNALLRRMLERPTDLCEATWSEPAASASNHDRATAVKLLRVLSVEDKKTLRLSKHRWAQPFVRAIEQHVIEQQNELECRQMVFAATKIAAVMRGKAARARARSVRTKLQALDAFMDGLVGNEEDSDEESFGAGIGSGSGTAADSEASVGVQDEVDSVDAAVAPPSVGWAEQMVLDIGLQIEQEEEQAAVRIQAIHRGKVARNTLKHT